MSEWFIGFKIINIILYARNMVFYIRFVVSKNNMANLKPLAKRTCSLQFGGQIW